MGTRLPLDPFRKHARDCPGNESRYAIGAQGLAEVPQRSNRGIREDDPVVPSGGYRRGRRESADPCVSDLVAAVIPWDDRSMVDVIRHLHRPIEMTIEGRTVRLYTVGYVCAVLNRSRPTISRWQRLKIFPPAAYILKPGSPNVRRRLYLEEFITALEELVERHPLERSLEPDQWAPFSRAVFAAHTAAILQVHTPGLCATQDEAQEDTTPGDQRNLAVR
jgi:hypothetical protein